MTRNIMPGGMVPGDYSNAEPDTTRARGGWRYWQTLPDGHRLFTAPDGRHAIADDSGATPEQTDDGRLWLDTSRPLTLDGVTSIPLVDDDGTATKTITDAPTVVLLASTFDWKVNVRGVLFTVKRASDVLKP